MGAQIIVGDFFPQARTAPSRNRHNAQGAACNFPFCWKDSASPEMRTILLVDDDEYCRAPAAELLRRAQWRVIEASDGEQGIEMAMKHRPDVILCDLLMPRGNGYHV